MTNTTIINLLPLEQHATLGAGFRADELYFIRLAGVYLQSIFWDVFTPTKAKSSRYRYRDMHLLAKQIPNASLRDSIVRNQRLEVKDYLSTHFTDFLNSFSDTLKLAFERRLKEHHALMLSFDGFVNYHHQLTEKRHFLEHFLEKTNKNKKIKHDDEKYIEALGVLLLREHHNLFKGRILAFIARKECDEPLKEQAHQILGVIDYIFSQCRKAQRRWNHTCLSEELAKTKIPDQKQRSHRHQKKERNRKALRITKGEYSEFEHRRRHHFIGTALYAAIEKELQQEGIKPVNFRWEVEAFYMLSCTINLHLHRALPEKRQCKGALRDIRNALAHTEMFWQVKNRNGDPYRVEQVFSEVLLSVKQHQGNAEAALLHNTLRGIMQKQVFTWVRERSSANEGAPTKVRIWKQWKQEKYREYRKDRRKRVRAIVGTWRVALEEGCTSAQKNAKKLSAKCSS